MWYQVVDKAGRDGNYLETSCTGMFAYSLLKSLRTGLCSKDLYRTQAVKALEGIKATYLRKDERGQLHLGGICSVAGLGGNPYRDGSFHYYICEPVVEDDFKGVGPFIKLPVGSFFITNCCDFFVFVVLQTKCRHLLRPLFGISA